MYHIVYENNMINETKDILKEGLSGGIAATVTG